MLKSIQDRKNRLRTQRKARVRGKIIGTEAKPRVSIFKSNKHIYAQAIVDGTSATVACADGRVMGLKANREDAKAVAQELAKNLTAQNIDTIVFDRNGYLYHGVVASFADALRESGIKF